MIPFPDAWSDAKDFLSANRVVRVCGVGDFTVVDFSDDGVFVMSKESSDPELVKREWFEAVWKILVDKKKLSAEDVVGRRPWGLWTSFILSLFAYQPYVSCSWDPEKGRFIYRM